MIRLDREDGIVIQAADRFRSADGAHSSESTYSLGRTATVTAIEAHPSSRQPISAEQGVSPEKVLIELITQELQDLPKTDLVAILQHVQQERVNG